MPRNYWKWTVPLLCVTCLGWVYSQEDPVKQPEKAPTFSPDPKDQGDDNSFKEDLEIKPRSKPLPTEDDVLDDRQEKGGRSPDSPNIFNIAPKSAPSASAGEKNRRNPLNSDSELVEPNQIGRGIHVDEFGDVTALSGTTEPRDHLRARVIQRSEPYMVKVALTDQEVAQLHDYQNAIAKLRSDESNAEAKTEAREKLTEILQQIMAADLEKRKQEVNTLELRVVKMRSQFDNRRAKQDQIIDLRLKTIQNEIDGLGLNQLLHPDGIEVNSQFTPAGGMSLRRYFDSMAPLPDSEGVGRLSTGGAEGGMGIAIADNELTPSRPMRTVQRYRTVSQRTLVALTPEEIAENEQYASSLKVLRSDEGDAAKQSARDALRELLIKRFTRDILTRENDLVELESRVKKLREQLDKRIAAKDQIVELQMATIQNEIDGLGFDEFQPEMKNVQVEVSEMAPVGLSRKSRVPASASETEDTIKPRKKPASDYFGPDELKDPDDRFGPNE